MDPRSGTGSLPNDSSITIFLTQKVDSVTVTDGSLYVERQEDGVRHAGYHTISTDGLRITFTPDPWFDTATSYRLVATQSIMSEAGFLLATEFRSTFSTGPWPSPKPVHQAQFSEVPEKMSVGRSSHTSTLLPNGYVLIAGGWRSGMAVTSSAEIYDPDNNGFFPALGSLSEGKGNHTATLMTNGLVLLAGGERDTDFRGLASCDLFSPATMRFVAAAPMNVQRKFHTATALPNGLVLVTGGRTLDDVGATVWHRSAELYDPSKDTWTFTGNEMDMFRAGHRATLMQDGRVLITGGSGNRVAEVYNPATDTFTTLASQMAFSRSLHGAVLMPNGVVFLSDGGQRTGELYDPDLSVFTPTSNQTSVVRSAALHLHFRPGEVLAVGGIDFDAYFIHATVEQYVQDYGPTGRYFSIAALPDYGVYLKDPRAYSAASRLTDGRFLITGGLGPSYDGPDLDTAILFNPAVEKPKE